MNAIIQLVDLNKKIWQWIVLVILAIIWGSSFILMKKSLLSFTYLQVASFRIFISFLLLIPFAIKRLSRVRSKHILPLMFIGVLGNGIPAFLFTLAQTKVDSSLAGVLNALTPLFALIVGLVLYKVKFIVANVIGITLGLIGAASLIIISSGFSLGATIIYPLFIVIATICYAFNVNITKEEVADLDGVTIIAVAFMFIGPFGGIYLLNSDFSEALANPYLVKSFSSVFLLALLSSVTATILFNYLIKYTTALFASSVTYIIPIVAIFWGLLDGETILLSQTFSIAIILFGVYLVNKKKT